ncbi:MAG: ATP phosphoribosyltransferase [Clostridia bacterium]|nr:ATP phosphoribosyltransferase [Clostridia bacterium]
MEKIKIALAKGRLAKTSFELFNKLGIYNKPFDKDTRKLIFSDGDVEIVLVKAGDVPTYVERGAVDIGVVGKDTLLQEEADIYEIMDLGFGRCKMAVAALKGYERHRDKKLRVASKYPKIARDYYLSKNEQVDIIYLSGSVELAPIVGLSDVIVDIVQTGATLKENGLEVIEDICDISARFVANKVSFKTKSVKIKEIIAKLQDYLEGEKDENN